MFHFDTFGKEISFQNDDQTRHEKPQLSESYFAKVIRQVTGPDHLRFGVPFQVTWHDCPRTGRCHTCTCPFAILL